MIPVLEETDELCPKCGHEEYRHFKDPVVSWSFCLLAGCECYRDSDPRKLFDSP